MLNNPSIETSQIQEGSYVGNDVANHAIAHGLGHIPKLVIITMAAAKGQFIIARQVARVFCPDPAVGTGLSVTAMDATNFYVGSAASHADSANQNGQTYYYTALWNPP